MNNKISHNCFCIIVSVFSLLLSLAVIQKCNAITTAFTVNTQQQLLQIPEDTEVKLDTETSLNGYQNYYVTVPNSITVLYFQIYSSHKFTFYIKQGSAPTKTIYDKEISITEKEGDDYTTKIDFDIIKSSTFSSSLNKDKKVVEDNYYIYFKVAGVSASVKIRTQDNELYWWYFLPIPILFYILIVVCLFVIVAQYIITKKKNKKNNSQNDGNESVDEKLTLNGNNINNKGGYSQI
ncbi:hypothetical protein ABK040_016889 [Willaertia magna]